MKKIFNQDKHEKTTQEKVHAQHKKSSSVGYDK